MGSELRQSMGISQDASVSATFGDLSKLSADSAYIRALSEILKRFPDHFHLFSGPGEIRGIRAHLHSEGVLPRVRFMGNMIDVAPLVEMSDLYLEMFPESNPDWARQAKRAGKPAVALSDSGTVAGYIEAAGRLIHAKKPIPGSTE